MKSAPFKYTAPRTIEDACRMLADAGAGGRPLAGGQSLAPMLHMRLMRPEVVVDLNRVDELSGIAVDGAGTTVGALTRYADIERSPLIRERLPLLQSVVARIGDRQVRNRGTIGGSLAQADPTAEMALACIALNATVVLVGVDSRRELAVEDFILGSYETALEPAELIVAVRFPASPGRCAFSEVGRKHNDFAIAAVAAVADRHHTGRFSHVRIAVVGVDDRAVQATTAAALLEGTALDDAVIDTAVATLAPVADPVDDVRASGEYRLAMAEDQLRIVLGRLRAGEGEDD